LEKRDAATKHLDRAALARVVDPAHYLGTAPQMVDRMVKG
jgi:3-carboxy-cis,cis-muconate cycloisomerase